MNIIFLCTAFNFRYVTIVLEETLDSSSSLGNLQGIRTFRVFRVLRTVSIVPGTCTLGATRAFSHLFEKFLVHI